jgi:hypothetical protein
MDRLGPNCSPIEIFNVGRPSADSNMMAVVLPSLAFLQITLLDQDLIFNDKGQFGK